MCRYFVLFIFSVFYADVYGSHPLVDVDVSTSERSISKVHKVNDVNPADYAHLVLGCGQEHNALTCAGFSHDHDEALTVDSERGDGHSEREWGVLNPLITGNVFFNDVWDMFQGHLFQRITAECIPLYRDPSCAVAAEYIRQGFDSKQARAMASSENYTFLLEKASTHLKPGGFLELYPGFYPAYYGACRLKGVFEEVRNALFRRGNVPFSCLPEESIAHETTLNILASCLNEKFKVYFWREGERPLFSKIKIDIYHLMGSYPFDNWKYIQCFEGTFKGRKVLLEEVAIKAHDDAGDIESTQETFHLSQEEDVRKFKFYPVIIFIK